jgi:hypothetical protein
VIAPQSPTGRLQNGNAPLALGVGSREPALYRLAAMAKCGSSGRLHSDANCARTPSCTFGRAIATSNSCLVLSFRSIVPHIWDGGAKRDFATPRLFLHPSSGPDVEGVGPFPLQMWQGCRHTLA